MWYCVVTSTNVVFNLYWNLCSIYRARRKKRQMSRNYVDKKTSLHFNDRQEQRSLSCFLFSNVQIPSQLHVNVVVLFFFLNRQPMFKFKFIIWSSNTTNSDMISVNYVCAIITSLMIIQFNQMVNNISVSLLNVFN